MPTYEYVCTDCNNQWEEMQKISADPLTDCPKCGKATAKRQISGGNFILKGGGWYADLYSSTPKKGDSAKAETSSTPATPATPAKSDGGGSSGSSGGGSSGSSGGGSSSGSSGGGGASSGGGSKASTAAA